MVLHSNYWDVAQIVLFREEDGWEHAYGPLMKKWLENAEKAAKFLQVMSLSLLPQQKEFCPQVGSVTEMKYMLLFCIICCSYH